MRNRVYSFSIKSDKDEEAVQKLKEQSRKTGVSFSWLVVQAIKKAAEVTNDN